MTSTVNPLRLAALAASPFCFAKMGGELTCAQVSRTRGLIGQLLTEHVGGDTIMVIGARVQIGSLKRGRCSSAG